MDAEASGKAPMAEASGLLRRQSRLIDEQIGLARNERFRNRIKAIRDLALSAGVLTLIGAASLTLWNARNASGLVVEALTTPPAMVAQGMDGTVLAGRLLDRLSAMQAATDSSRAPATFGSNWGNDLSVEVPQTGVSASELWRMLRQTLGAETRLSGDLIERDGQLTLTTRIHSNPGQSVSGAVGDLDRLLDETAQAVYRQAQPYRYSVWLNRQGRGGNVAILQQLAASGDRTEQLWARVGLSVNAYVTDPELALSLAREALAMDPSFHKARWNVSDALAILGRQEEDLHELRLIERAMRRRDQRVTKVAQDQVLHSSRGTIAEYKADFVTVVKEGQIRGTLPDYAGNAPLARYTVSWASTALHDRKSARQALAVADRSAEPQQEYSAYTAALIAEERGDLPGAAQLVRTALSIGDANQESGWLPQYRAAMARILLRAGDRAAANSLLSVMREDCYPCMIIRGQAAALDGRWSEAERQLLRATTLGPSLPTAWQALGQVRLRRGDGAGAVLAFTEAAQRGPLWADPLKFWGEALAASGDHRGACRKYSQAAERAPRWGALMLAWGRSLEAISRPDEALEKYQSALGMDLNALERADVNRRLDAIRSLSASDANRR